MVMVLSLWDSQCEYLHSSLVRCRCSNR